MRVSWNGKVSRNPSGRVGSEEEKKGMIFWKPKTEAEQKLLELYAMEEDETIRDRDQNRRPEERKGRNPGKEFEKARGM